VDASAQSLIYSSAGPLGGESSVGSFFFGDPNNPLAWSVAWQISASSSYAWNETKGVWDVTGGGLYTAVRHPVNTLGGLMFLASALPSPSGSGYGGSIMAQMQIYDAASAWGSRVASGDPRAVGQFVGTAATFAYAAKNVQIGANKTGGGGLNILNTPTRGSRIGIESGSWKGGSGLHLDVYIKRIPGGWNIWEAAKGMGSNWFKLEHWQPW